jgi:S-DNA-T family DNA segregation ATPase FtsK/SpoIIIE
LADLSAPERNVEGLAAVLSEVRSTPFQTVQRLKNVSHHEVLDALLDLAQMAQKDDFVLVYFAGHARLDTQDRLYLAASNTQSDLLGSTALALEQIKDVIDTCPSTRIILILDCYYSTVTGAPVALQAVAEQMRWAASGRGKYILSAAPTEPAGQEPPAAPESTLTQHLIEGLRTGHADIDRVGFMTIDQLYRYACAKVLQASGAPPMKWDLSGRGGLILARTRTRPGQGEGGATAYAAVQAHYEAIAQLL